MRLIDGDSLKRNLERLWDMHDDYDFANKDVWQEIENAPVIEPERKWIPVTDRLPKDNRQVLVYAQSTHFVLAKYDEMIEPNGEWKKQWVTFDAWKPYYTVKNVIAWMPLPDIIPLGNSEK